MIASNTTQHLMLLPTLDCPAACRYCFGPHEGKGVMSRATLQAVIRWLQASSRYKNAIEITFHGGEPLLPGEAFYRMALPNLQESLAPRKVIFGVQSNLWPLNDSLCEILKKYRVSLGTSLDGPEAINDAQRGRGYFQETMRGIRLAHSNGLDVGCICTFTESSANHAEEVFEFFLNTKLSFSIHAALPPLNRDDVNLALSPEAFGPLLVTLLVQYLVNTTSLRISTLDSMARSISAGKGGICTFNDCLGYYLAVDPEGWLYPCQRMAGIPAFRLGNVHDQPSDDDLSNAPIWIAMQARQARVGTACEDCPHLPYCRGGCPYNVLAANNGRLDENLRDPYCPAYRQVFDTITDRALTEVFSKENLSAVMAESAHKNSLLRRGPLLQIMRGGPHPQEVARQARQTVAAAALGVYPTPESALSKLEQVGVITDPTAALGSLRRLREQLNTQSQQSLVNAYLHVTDACNLSCTHCYAISHEPGAGTAIDLKGLVDLIHQLARAGFAKVVITGGEPLMHPQRDDLLEALSGLRTNLKPMQITLRTNLAYPLSQQLIDRLLSAVDEVVVSFDGDQSSHDAQRGPGSYDLTLQNLRAICEYQQRIADLDHRFTARIRLSATLIESQMEGIEGEAVRQLGNELNLQVRIKPILPLGRGKEMSILPVNYSTLDDDLEKLAHGASPVASCGLGMNLYIGADGNCFPCYALLQHRHHLGNALLDGLAQVLVRNDTYRAVTVDSNRSCHTCALRYLCGGYCRAWRDDDNPDAPALNCSALYQRAEQLLFTALDVLKISENDWITAGLPLTLKDSDTEQ